LIVDDSRPDPPRVTFGERLYKVPRVRVLLWHGYLMSGTGSNIYTANVARSWKRAGHDVLVMCQERHPERLEFVDECAVMAPGGGLWRSPATSQSGRCRVLRPYIGDVLPVYVLDSYEGTEAKRFVDLSEEELTFYTQANIDALAAVIEDFDPEAIITGHEVMGPYIAREACAYSRKSYVAKLHGSALEYAVKLQERYQHFAASGLSAARYVVGGSRYMIDAASEALPGWKEKARVINPGCDVELFRPIEREIATKLRVCYVGKLIASKGVDHLLTALPLVEGEIEGVIIGFGGDETQLRSLWSALHAGDKVEALRLASLGDLFLHESLARFIEAQPQSYFDRAGTIDVSFAGRLDHEPLSKVLPTFDVLVAPSVVAEAFGMVAAEAAACGVLPVVPRHSGIGEAGAVLEAALDVEGMLCFDPATPIEGIAAAVTEIRSMSAGQREEKGAAAAEVARRLWSWEVVATKLLDLAAPA
jgi:glycosyltransferase involved in cell wall biosynthesis